MLSNKTHLLKKINKKIINHIKSEIGIEDISCEVLSLKKEISELKEVINHKNNLINSMNKRIASSEKDMNIVTNDLISAITILNEIYYFLESLNKNKKVNYH
jgi:hypothetical protein